MKIPKPPYNGVTDSMLFATFLGGDCIEYRNIEVTSDYATELEAPEQAIYALIVVEADVSSANKEKVIRFKEHDTEDNPPTATEGIPLGDLSTYEVKGSENIKNFRAIGIEEGKTHSLKVQFYS